MPGPVGTVAKELQQLFMGLGQRASKRRGARVAEQVAQDVLGTDGATISKRARQVARRPVTPKGEAAKVRVERPVTQAQPQFTSNRVAGARRESIVRAILEALYPADKGYVVKGEQYLRDRFGRIAHDAETGQSRRIDFAVFRGKRVHKLLEVTSETVNKAAQLAKEARMRRHGARYVLHPESGDRLRIPAAIKTAVVRLP